MPKRKLQSTNNPSSSKKSSVGSGNPFLLHFGNDDAEGDNNADFSFQPVLEFIQLTKHQKKQDSVSEDGEQVVLLDDAVEKILLLLAANYGSKDDDDDDEDLTKRPNNGLISTSNLVTLLLPWAVKSILHHHHSTDKSDGESTELQWRSLEACLSWDGLLAAEINTSKFLSTSVLHKLVPIAVNVACQQGDDDSSKTRRSIVAGKCYCTLVDNIYRPPFDSICDSLFPLVARSMSELEETSDAEMVQPILKSTLTLFLAMMTRANPKKSFQQLVQPDVFSALSDIYVLSTANDFEDCSQIVRNIFLNGIFSLENHLDGFRSIQLELPDLLGESKETEEKMDTEGNDGKTQNSPAKSEFRCYQEGLLTLIDESLCNGMDSGEDSQSTSAIMKAIPLLLESFVHQSTILQEQLRAKPGRKKAAYKISQIQFQFFTRITFPLLKRLQEEKNDTSVREGILECVGQNLDIVLKHDVYLPSNNEQSEKDFACLSSLMKVVMQTMTGNESASRNEWRKILKILTTLSSLNHLVLHDQVPTIIANCLAYSDSQSRLVPETVNLLVTLIDTYQKLRQLDYFFRSITRLADMLQGANDTSPIYVLLRLGDDKEVRTNLEKAVQNSPLEQLRKIFSEMNEWIEEASHMYFDGNDDSNAENGALVISAVVRLFSILIRNVRVDMATSHEIYTSCQDIINTAVHGLLGDGKLDQRTTTCTKDALMLCAWSIDLKNRCDFWIRNSQEKATDDSFTIPPPIVGLIKDAVDFMDGNVSPSNRSNGYEELEELQFLACYRIHQLHTDIHEKQRIAFATDSHEYDCSDEAEEAAKLAKFALKATKKEETTDAGAPSRLDFLAGSIASWAPYAESQDLDSFLYDVLSNVASAGSARQESSLLSLLHDAGFYEIEGISRRMCGAGLSCTAGLMRQGLNSLALSKMPPDLLDLTCPMRHLSWIRSERGQLETLLGKKLTVPRQKIKAQRLKEALQYFQRALHCTRVLNGMPSAVWLASDDASDVLESILRIEILCTSMGKVDVEFKNVIVDLVSALRFALSCLLRTPECIEVAGKHVMEKMVENLFNSTPELMKYVKDSSAKQPILIASQRLLLACVECCDQNPDSCAGLDAAIHMSLSEISELEGDDKLTGFTFCRCIVNGLDKLLLPTSDVSKQISQSLHDFIGKQTTKIFKSLKEDTLTYAFETQCCDRLRDEALLIVAEMLRHSDKANLIDAKRSIESRIVEMAGEALDEKSGLPGKISTWSYLIACLAMTDISPETRVDLASRILVAGTKSNGVLESAACKLIEGMPPNEMEKLLEVLATEDSHDGRDTARIRFFRYMVLNLTAPGQIEVIAKFSRRFLFRSLQMLDAQSGRKETEGDRALCAIELIIDMFRSKDIIKTNERDIALILCHVNIALNPHGAAEREYFTPASTGVFDACFAMVSFLLQRFSKQLHYCVPSVTSTLTVMLQHSIYGHLKEDDIKNRGQKFTRLCELLMPHKEVYKKHILCLLVEFIQALRGDIDAARKNSMSPAVYCLLDILSQHETAQLNSMLDDMGRALFRSLHESYKKLHVYKGQ